MITCERPYAFYLLLLLIPAAFYATIRFHRIVRLLGGFYGTAGSAKSESIYHHLKISMMLRTAARSCAWIMIVLAYAGLSWGTESVPVQKSGNAVCFVFDISYSTLAADAPGGLTRLEAERRYADQLLLRMPGTSVAVVLAKGDGITAVPLTEDMTSVESLLDCLSPSLMTAAGTSLGKGVTAALHAFPENSAQASSIWVFTDGDETDGSLSSSLAECVRCGVPVTLIGFGSTKEIEVTAGDGTTIVKTALREKKLQTIASDVSKQVSSQLHRRFLRGAPVQYVNASEIGSALRVMRTLSGKDVSQSDDMTVTYELQSVPRYKFFILLAVVFYLLSYVAGEIVMPEKTPKKDKKKTGSPKLGMPFVTLLFCIVCIPAFTSCSSRTKNGAMILKSTWMWYQKQYQQATTGFLDASEKAAVENDTQIQQYAVYGLAVTYLMQDENDAALERLSQIAPDAPQQIRYAALYNAGVIADKQGDYNKAANLFKQAIIADGSKIDAKINLELCHREESVRQSQSAEQQMNPVSENSDESSLEKAVFSVIRENEQNTWKNNQSDKKDYSAIDY